MSDDSEEEEYVVEAIVNIRKDSFNKKEYLIKWGGWDEPTWEPHEQFDLDHADLVAAYKYVIFRRFF